LEGQTAKSLGLTGQEEFSIIGLESGIASRFANGNQLHIRATNERGDVISFDAICRIDTPTEMDYYRHGGVLQYVLRGLLS
jgi:aconitate hydratase